MHLRMSAEDHAQHFEATPPRPKWGPRTISVSVAGVQMETLLLDRLFSWISEVVVVGV